MLSCFNCCAKRDRDVSGAKRTAAPRLASSPEVADGLNRPLVLW